MNLLNRPWQAAFLLFLGVVLIYWIGLPGGMLFDDEPNLWSNPRFIFTAHNWENFVSAIWSSQSGPTGRPVSMLTFAINQWFSGLDDVTPYKITNIIIHGFSTLAAFFLAQRLLTLFENKYFFAQEENNNTKLAVIIALLWGLHPLQLTSVLYIVQRMTSLAGLFSFISLLLYLKAREKQNEGAKFSSYFSPLCASLLLMLAAILSKESALVLGLYYFLLEVWLLKFAGATIQQTQWIKRGYAAVFSIGLILVVCKLWQNPGFILGGYEIRHFTPSERLLTQTRVLVFYLSQLCLPILSNLSLYHDDFLTSKSFTDPLSTLFCSLFWCVALMLVFIPSLRQRFTLLSFALAWFMVGHVLESTIWPLEMVHEHRNYFPSYGLIFSTVIGAQQFALRYQIREQLQKTVVIAFILIFAGITAWRASLWSNPTELAFSELRNHPESSRASYEAGRHLVGLYEKEKDIRFKAGAEELFLNSNKHEKTGANFALLGLIYLAGVDQQPPNDEVLHLYQEKLASSVHPTIMLGQLEKLSEHQLEGKTALTNQQYLQLLHAYLKNPHISDEIRGSVYLLLGHYFLMKIKSMPDAEASFLKARDYTPHKTDKYIALAMFYAMNKDYSRTKEMLALAKQQPDAWQYRNKIDWSSIANEPK